MKRYNWIIVFVGIMLMFNLNNFKAQTTNNSGITPQMIQKFRNSFKLNAHNRALINAVTNNSVKKLVVNRKMIAGYDNHFSKRIKIGSITNQEKSGRCWLFAGLNIMRPIVRKKLGLKNFEFSESYSSFWDKLEKANFFLESIIKTRKLGIRNRKVEFILKNPFSDGGQWSYVVDLIQKYGVVPKNIMPETQQSSKTGVMNMLISRKLRQDAVILRRMSKEGKSLTQLRNRKTEMLEKIYHILVINFGVPPVKFQWRYKNKKGKLSQYVNYTPVEFFHKVVGVNLNNYVSLFNVPTKPYNKLYQVQLDRDMANSSNLTFININIDSVRAYTLRSVLANEPVWFGCDVGKELYMSKGILAPTIYDYSDLYGMNFNLTKKEQILYHDSVPTHAMVFTGVDVIKGKPVKWLVENSWGPKAGNKGYLTMFNKWFNHYVYNVIINKKYLPKSVLGLLKTTPIVLPPWDPMYSIL